MNDKEFERKMKKCADLKEKHGEILRELEVEYEKRFGFNPSDIDDDFWIDTFHYGSTSFNFADVIEQAKFSSNRAKESGRHRG